MSENKRYYWFKLSDDFFKDRRLKRLRRLAGGDTYTIIYQKMLLLSLSTNGIYSVDEFEDLAESISLDIDEELDNVRVTLEFLKSCDLVVENPDSSILFTDVEFLTGSETASTIRSRKCRQKKALQCNTNASESQPQSIEYRDKSIEYRDKSIEYRDKSIDVREERESKKETYSPNSPNTHALSQQEYSTLISVYGKELVDIKIEKSKKYKNCTNFKTIRKWCDEEVQKEVDKEMNKMGLN